MASTNALKPWLDDIWVATRRQRFWGLETGTKMTIVRLSDGGLFVGKRRVERILEWDIERIALAHGASVTERGRGVVKDAYRWL